MTPADIKRGDIVTYQNGRTNHVNKIREYKRHYNENLTNKTDPKLNIVKIERYVKCLFFYRKKTVYERMENPC